jgi:hypothetical protein
LNQSSARAQTNWFACGKLNLQKIKTPTGLNPVGANWRHTFTSERAARQTLSVLSFHPVKRQPSLFLRRTFELKHAHCLSRGIWSWPGFIDYRLNERKNDRRHLPHLRYPQLRPFNVDGFGFSVARLIQPTAVMRRGM